MDLNTVTKLYSGIAWDETQNEWVVSSMTPNPQKIYEKC